MRISKTADQGSRPDRHDVASWAEHTKKRPAGPQRLMMGAVVLAGGLIGAAGIWWLYPGNQTASTPPGQAVAAVQAAPNESQGSEGQGRTALALNGLDLRISDLAIRTAYAYLRFPRGEPEVETQRYQQTLSEVGIDPKMDYGHHPGDGPHGITPTNVEIWGTEALEGDRTRVNMTARIPGKDTLRWIGLAVVIQRNEDGQFGLVGRPTFTPVPEALPVHFEAYPDRRSRNLEQALNKPVNDGFRTWSASPQGLDGLMELQTIHEIIISDNQPEHGPITGQVALDWIDPISRDTFSQVMAFRATRNGATWTVTPTP